MDEDQDQDDYVGQLREVFDQCDTEGNGALNRDGLLELCNSLQLQDQAEQLIGELLGDSTGGLVDFDTFKEAFVNILATTVDFDTDLDDIGGVSDVDRDDDDRSVSSYHNPVSDADIVDEVSPKYVKGNKKYGRRSKPDINVDTADISDVETDVSSYAGLPPDKSHHSKSEARGTKREGDRSEHGYHLSKRNSVSFADDLSQGGSLDLERELDFDQDPVIDGVDVPQEPLSPERVDGEGTSILETFEAEGQNNASISQYAGTPTQDQSQVAAIEAIWEEVGVGKDGFLDIDELKIVCEHIGMEDMDNEELDNLFVKLDEDKDGRVGFDEFLRGLFSHTASATPTPIPIGMSPAQRANLRRLAGSSMDDPYQRTTTPSILVSQSSKLFSMLDPNNLGYARPEDIEEQLEREGIDNPAEIMEILDINMEAGKVNLQDLSSRLENILLAKGDDDGVYQVALATYQGELKYIRSQLDIVTDERDHLKDDITEANHRNTKLAQEVDDRHNNILRQNEKQLQALEEQYQDKIISLQAQIEKERESLTTEELGVRESLEKEIEQWKAEDALGKEKILLLQKENGRLEEELVEATERLIENEKTIQKQQRDLEGFQELEERLADLESNREKVSKQQEEYFESNIKEYQEKIRLLQDKMDELTQENDLLKNQGTERKTRRRASKIHASKPGRIGSVLSDYVNKPNVQRRLSSSENESELEELDPNLRRLPARSGGDGTSNEEEDKKKLEEEREKWEAEMTELKEDHKKELEEARIMFEHECKDIEQKYKIEISGLEEEMELKKDEARNQFEKLRVEFKGEQAKLVEELERQFKSERTETHEKNEREKHSREEEIAREKADLRDELEAKYNKELDNRIAELKQQLLVEKTELENLLVKEKSDVEKDLLKAKNEAEMKLKQRELDFVKEKGELESEFGSEKSELLQNYNAKVHELEQIFLNGEAGLKGQLRQDFTNLLDQHKAEMEESYKKEREELKESHEREKEEMNHAFELERVELLNGKENERSDIVERLQKEKAELVNKNKKDKLEAFEKHRREKAEMTEKFKKEKDALNEKHKKERSEWDQKLQKERERFRKEREDREEKFQRELAALELNLSVDKDNLEHTIRMDVEEKIRQDLKTEMEGDYVEQMHRLKENFEDEKSEFIVEKEEMEDRLRAAERAREEAIQMSSAQQLHAAHQDTGADKDKVQRSSSLPGQIDIKTDGSSQVKTTSLPDNRLKSSASDPRGMHPSTDRRQHTGGMHPTTDGREHPRGMHTGTDSRQHPATDGRLTGEVHPSTDGRQHTGVGTGMLSHKGPLHGTLAGLPNDRDSYEALAIEQGKLAQSVQGLERKFNQSIIRGQMSKQARIEMLEQNCDRLKHELSETGKKLLEAEMQISIAEAQRMRELQRLKDKQNRDTDKEVSKLKKDILEKDHVVRELEKALSMKADQLGQAANRSKDELNQEVKEMRDQKVELEKKYRNTQRLLDEYMRKLKEQLTRSTRSDVLVKELYVENSKLQKALQVTEERQKIAEKNCHNLREKNHAYLHVLRRIAPAAM
ncbi:uncharacterized protein [Amphiura filiformis]|uniref:uncharacterized protein isoform X7 n=1 Tax=Amphiura filiformis TaxID=82378 RepID=UPI003B2288C9